VEAAMWATRTSDAQMWGRSRGCITTSYFTLLNYNTSMAFLDIIKAKKFKNAPVVHIIQITERDTNHRLYKCNKAAQ